MIDMHSHILFGIDDGCSNIDEAVSTIKAIKNLGFDGTILTPHYIKGTNYEAPNKLKKEILSNLKEELERQNIDINVYLGNEVFATDEITNLVMERKIRTLNNTRYILIEFPMHNEINNLLDYLYELKLKGFIPIIAHPERYSYFQKDYEKARKLYKEGVYFQCNYGSIIDEYGTEAKKLFTYLLEHDMVSFLATDVHKPSSSLFDNFNQAKEKIINIIGNNKFKEISNDNILKVINDYDVIHNDIKDFSKTIWDLFKKN